MRKINYNKRWDSKGCVYKQTITISKEEFAKVQKTYLAELIKNENDKNNKIDWYHKLFLKSTKGLTKKNNTIFTNLTQRDFFVKILNISSNRLVDENTCFNVR